MPNNAPIKTRKGLTYPAPDDRPVPKTERQQFAREAEDARLAISGALAAAVGHAKSGVVQLKGAADPHLLTEARPWLAVGGAAGAGLLAGLLAVPSKRQSAKRRLKALRQIVELEASAGGKNVKLPGAKKSSWTKKGALLAFRLARPTIISALTAGLTAKAATDGDDDS